MIASAKWERLGGDNWFRTAGTGHVIYAPGTAQVRVLERPHPTTGPTRPSPASIAPATTAASRLRAEITHFLAAGDKRAIPGRGPARARAAAGRGPLGSGGYGVAYKAQHIVLDGARAVKTLAPIVAIDDAGGEDVALRRFAREASMLGRIASSRVVRFFDAGCSS